jgi:hypothetical protein
MNFDLVVLLFFIFDGFLIILDPLSVESQRCLTAEILPVFYLLSKDLLYFFGANSDPWFIRSLLFELISRPLDRFLLQSLIVLLGRDFLL